MCGKKTIDKSYITWYNNTQHTVCWVSEEAMNSETKDNLIYDAISEEIVSVTERLAMRDGAKNVNVRRVLNEMNVTNRVFYNRFHNIDEVLEIVYENAVVKMQDSVVSNVDINENFFEYIIDVAVNVLIKTYDVKQQFSQYMFEHDSLTEANRLWWDEKIKSIAAVGRATGKIKDLDDDKLSYTIWCFFRGFNADAVHRNLSKEEAVDRFSFGLRCLFDGIKKQ